ncbi:MULTISPECIES: helix-turn-helix domain-containing protein [Pectobacterium]|uniref:helix-turn-helix domain-containing protein n=1 Tax=Pectobacterium TaxID=122277 RepID=UPI0010FF0A0E|nr:MULTISPECIES: helix-turn-helix transcriptional regulator [Pectobacterium]KAA3668660.1 helix-turn-helix transcriptional regulator [Pectobacterium carotovorum subsp. carotovorum]MCA6968405.1 helix-turn-helix domain-containing protein [Pectobacterium carotovorum]MCH4997334.1 helix-turn-helix transcriptional regulator [Pectobacterium carotovorum]UCZ80080.1 helix-turn-helix domain-containing protein [Pectobacterium carotovorum]
MYKPLDRLSASFNEEFRKSRLDRNLTQNELAIKLGISSVMVQRYESNGKPSPKTLDIINKFFSSFDINEQKEDNLLKNYSLDELISEIRRRGFSITLRTNENVDID